MFRTAMLAREESRIFEELLRDVIRSAMSRCLRSLRRTGRPRICYALGLLGRGGGGVGTSAGRRNMVTQKQRTREQVLRINQEIVKANRAPPRRLLREEFSLAHSETVSALRVGPDQIEETSPLARIVSSQCVRHRGHHLAQLRAWVERLQGSF